MVFTILKSSFKRSKARELLSSSYKKFDKNIFKEQLRCKLINWDEYALLEKHILDVLNEHSPLKVIRSNEVPYMTKDLRKAIADSSRLENRYYKLKKGKETIAVGYIKGKEKCFMKA